MQAGSGGAGGNAHLHRGAWERGGELVWAPAQGSCPTGEGRQPWAGRVQHCSWWTHRPLGGLLVPRAASPSPRVQLAFRCQPAAFSGTHPTAWLPNPSCREGVVAIGSASPETLGDGGKESPVSHQCLTGALLLWGEPVLSTAGSHSHCSENAVCSPHSRPCQELTQLNAWYPQSAQNHSSATSLPVGDPHTNKPLGLWLGVTDLGEKCGERGLGDAWPPTVRVPTALNRAAPPTLKYLKGPHFIPILQWGILRLGEVSWLRHPPGERCAWLRCLCLASRLLLSQ